MADYNEIGIESTLDWSRIRKLMIIGLFGAAMTFIGDFRLYRTNSVRRLRSQNFRQIVQK